MLFCNPRTEEMRLLYCVEVVVEMEDRDGLKKIKRSSYWFGRDNETDAL